VHKILKFLNERFEEVVGIVSLAVTMTLIFIGVVMRVLFKSGIPWQEELSRILYVFVVYVGASYGIRYNDHIRVTFLLQLLPSVYKRLLDALADLIWIGFNGVIIYLSLDTYIRMRQTLGETAVLMIPLHYVFMIIPGGFILLTFRLLQTFVAKCLKRARGTGP